jgi:hypothetical protein
MILASGLHHEQSFLTAWPCFVIEPAWYAFRIFRKIIEIREVHSMCQFPGFDIEVPPGKIDERNLRTFIPVWIAAKPWHAASSSSIPVLAVSTQ